MKRGASSIGFEGAVAEECGWVRRGGDQVELNLMSCNDGFWGGTMTEEVGVERVREG